LRQNILYLTSGKYEIFMFSEVDSAIGLTLYFGPFYRATLIMLC